MTKKEVDMNLIKTMISHTGLPGHSCVRNVYRNVEPKATLPDIKKIVWDSGNVIAGDLSMYAPFIEITNKDETKFILDEIYMELCKPFDIAPTENVKLSVEWKLDSKASPIVVVQTPSNSTTRSHAISNYNRQQISSYQGMDELDTVPGIPVQKNNNLIQNSNTQKADELNGRVDNLKDPGDGTGHIHISTNDRLSDPCSSEQASFSTNRDHNESVSSGIHFPSKRSNQTQGHEISCKKTKSNIKQNNSTILVGTSLQKCLEKTFRSPHSGEINMWYNPSTMSVLQISDFQPDNMLKMKVDIHKHQEAQYISDRDPIKSKESKGRKLVRLQGKKDSTNCRMSILPEIKIPQAYKDKIEAGASVVLCCSCVMECYSKETGEIRFYTVGNKSFVIFPNSINEKQVEKLYFGLNKEHLQVERLQLEATVIKIEHRLDQEIGDGMFILTKEYVGLARLCGFKFGAGDPLHRLALFLYVFDDNEKVFKPDLTTLCLTDYMHQQRGQEDED